MRDTVTETPTRPGVRRKRLWWAVAGGVVLIAAAAFLLLRARAIPITSVAVLTVTGDEALAPGITEEILDDLARVPGLRLETQAAAQPPVDAVLQASFERTGNHARLLMHLDRTDGRRAWTRTFERPLTELSLLPGDVAAFISPEARKRAPKHKPAAEAYQAYLEGRTFFARQEMDKAIAAFQRAADADSDFALAWAWLSIAREYPADAGAVRPNESLPGARDAAERSVTMAGDLAEPHIALGIVRLQYDWEWQDARRELDRALQLSPGSRMAQYWRKRWLEATAQQPPHPLNFANLPPVHGDADARKLLDDADDIRVEKYISPVALALVANSVHDTDRVFHWLDEAYDERSVQLPYALWDPALPRSDPRMADLMHRMNLPPTE